MGEEKQNGDAAGEKPAPAAEIVRQVEYYFSDVNLSRDKFLLAEVAKSDGGWVDMSVLITFKRLAKLAANQESVVLDALADVEDTDGLMEVDKEAKRIRRKPSKPLPADRENFLSALAARTLYIKGLDKDWDLDQVMKFLEPYGPYEAVHMRRWKAEPGVKNFKGSALLTFADVAAAEKFLAVPDIKCGETVLIRKWKNDWSLEKEEETKARREKQKQAKLDKKHGNKQGGKESNAKSPPKKRKFDGDGEEEEGEKKEKKDDEPESKKQKAESGSGDKEEEMEEAGKEDEEEDEEDGDEEEKEDEVGVFAGSLFKLKGIPKEDVHVMDIRTALRKFESDGAEVAFVNWTLGQEEAVVRLKERDSAKKTVEKINAAEPVSLEVKGTKLTAVELEPEEEKKLLTEQRQNKKEAMAKQKNKNKGRGGFGGRGRGRGRGGGRGGRRGRGRRR